MDAKRDQAKKRRPTLQKNILDATFKPTSVCFGVAVFAFSEEWWKAGSNDTQDPRGWVPNSSGVPYDGSPNEEYWGIVDVDRNKKSFLGCKRSLQQKLARLVFRNSKLSVN